MKDQTKQTAKKIMGKLKSAFDRGFGASKRALGIAGDAVQDFSDKTATRIEKSQLESKLKKQYEALGEYVNNALTTKRKVELNIKNKDIVAFVNEIARLKNEIKIRLDSLENDTKKSVVAKKEISTKSTTVKKSSTQKTATKKVAPKSVSKTTTKPVAKKTSTTKSAATKKAPSKPTTKKTTSKK